MEILSNQKSMLYHVMTRQSNACARIKGSNQYPHLSGKVCFYQMDNGVVVLWEFFGLPFNREKCSSRVFALHIHEGKVCDSSGAEAFASAGSHYNPEKCEHPEHAGDLPPVFGNRGYGWGGVFTDRFTVDDIIGRTVILHEGKDDFSTQPSGNAGARIGCGVIRE